MSVQLLDGLLAARLLDQDTGAVSFRYDWLRAFLSGELAPPAHRQRIVLGLTGNIAMGKSTVLNMLAKLGAQVIDADRLVHRLREPGAPGYAPLLEALGRDVLLPDGRVDTAALSRKAFQDPAVLACLEHIFRPLVVAEIGQMLQRSVHAVVVIEAIKLLEGGLRNQVDQVWVVDAPREQQIRRLMTDRGYSREQAIARIEAQNPQADKLAQADVIIRNEGDLAATWRQVLDAWVGVLDRLAQAGELPATLVETFVRVSLEQAEPAALPEAVMAGLQRLAQAIGPKDTGIAREQAETFFQ